VLPKGLSSHVNIYESIGIYRLEYPLYIGIDSLSEACALSYFRNSNLKVTINNLNYLTIRSWSFLNKLPTVNGVRSLLLRPILDLFQFDSDIIIFRLICHNDMRSILFQDHLTF